MTRVEIIFDNINKARAFITWLSECGEQYYFEDMIGNKESVSEFKYHLNHLIIVASGELSDTNNVV